MKPLVGATVLLVVVSAACSSSSSSKSPQTPATPAVAGTTTTYVPEVGDPTAKDCAEIARRNAVQAKYDAGVDKWNKLTDAQHEQFADFVAWAKANGFPTVNPGYGTITSDACG